MSIGVDLHKTQFTVCELSEDRKIVEFREYPTNDSGYEEFIKRLIGFCFMNLFELVNVLFSCFS